jgi:outer membrane protein OmpA-like peptidoglycan-associated protein
MRPAAVLAGLPRTLAACALLGLAAPAVANDVDLRVDNRAEPGQKPKLTIVVNKDLESAIVTLDGGGQRFKQKQGPQTAPGQLHFELPQTKAGVVQWKGSLEVTFADGASGSMPLAFATEVLSADFTFGFGKDDLDLAGDRLTLKSERATARVEIEVYGDDDELLASAAQDYSPAIPAGQPVPVSWVPKKKADVLRLRITVHDDRGSYRSSDSFPYSITIPHEDVVFDTGKSVIRADQEPKLRATLPEIEKAVKRFGPAMKAAGATVRLFVSGHTDTVGPASSNQALSHARAVAIATWFARQGVPVGVYARGFGESVLKVQTPDETDNETNRRVDYDIGVNGPTGSLTGWTRIK